MKPSILILVTLILTWFGSIECIARPADEMATSEESPPAAPSPTPSSTPVPIPDNTPSIKHIDDYYQAHPNQIDCKADWNRFRAIARPTQLAKPNLEQIKANAEKLGLSSKKVEYALSVFLKNQDQLPNQNYVGIADFDKSATQDRLFIIDLKTSNIATYKVAHGEGSGPKAGTPNGFSNIDSTHASSLGCAISTFDKDNNGTKMFKDRWQPKMIIHGMETTNDNVCARAIFWHSATYVGSGGRSHGCPAVEPEKCDEIYNKLREGGLLCTLREGEYKVVTATAAPKKSKKVQKRNPTRKQPRKGRRK